MSCESKPDVISTPMQHRKSQKYIIRRFGFLYHTTLSSATRRVTMGSAVVPTFTLTILAVGEPETRFSGVGLVLTGVELFRVALSVPGGLASYIQSIAVCAPPVSPSLPVPLVPSHATPQTYGPGYPGSPSPKAAPQTVSWRAVFPAVLDLQGLARMPAFSHHQPVYPERGDWLAHGNHLIRR